MLQLCMPARHEADLRSLKTWALRQGSKPEGNHPTYQISVYRWQDRCLEKWGFFPRLIKISPLRWTGFLTENSITNRAKPISSPRKLVYLRGGKKNQKPKYFCHIIRWKPKRQNMEILLKCLKTYANSFTPFSPRGRHDLPWHGKVKDSHFAAPQLFEGGRFLKDDLAGWDNVGYRKHTSSPDACTKVQRQPFRVEVALLAQLLHLILGIIQNSNFSNSFKQK